MGENDRSLASVRVLCVYAHPDDESFGPSAALASWARRGASIHGLFFTRGERGETHLDPPPTPAELARLREADLREAAAAIGITGLEILDYEDGSLESVPQDELADHVRAAIVRVRPDVVFTFGPRGITGHADHVAVHHAVVVAFHQARDAGLAVRELYYDAVPPDLAREAKEIDVDGAPDGQPNTFIPIGEADHWVKLRALRIHARHMADARTMVERVEERPAEAATFYRAWPPVAPGERVTALLQHAL